MNIITSGRDDFTDFFQKSDISWCKRLQHTPILVFMEKGDNVEIKIVEKPDDLQYYSRKSKCMAQWKGEWRSDFFQFTVGDYLDFLKNR